MGVKRTTLYCLGISIGHPLDGPGIYIYKNIAVVLLMVQKTL